jgi:hypothetical protein
VFTDTGDEFEHRRFLERYRFVDFALKVVGVGSVGTRCFIIVLQGRDENDPLILQAKEATASVMEPYLAVSEHASHAQRVVVGQQLMQGTSDILLGWTRGPGGRDFYSVSVGRRPVGGDSPAAGLASGASAAGPPAGARPTGRHDLGHRRATRSTGRSPTSPGTYAGNVRSRGIRGDRCRACRRWRRV